MAVTITLTAPRATKLTGAILDTLDAAIATSKGVAGQNIGLSLAGGVLTVHDYPNTGVTQAEVNAAIDAYTRAVPTNPYDTPIATDLANARAALVTAMGNLNTANTAVQGLAASPTVAALTTAVKDLSTAVQAYDVANNNALTAIRDALAILRARG